MGRPSSGPKHGCSVITLWFLAGLAAVMSPAQAQVGSSAYNVAIEALTPKDMDAPWDIPTAIANLQTALAGAEEPAGQAKINLLLGLCYMWDGQIDKAIDASEAVLEYDPNMVADFPEQGIWGLSPLVRLGDCYRAKGDWATALQWWEKAIRQFPDGQAVMANLVMARRELGNAHLMGSLPPAVMVGQTYLTGPTKNANNRVLATGADLGRLLGARVKWDHNKRELEIVAKGLKLVLSAGATKAVLNGRQVPVPVAPAMAGGQLLVPLRFVAETFGRRVIWEAPGRIAWVR